MKTKERYFCANCKRKLAKVEVWYVPSMTVAAFHDLLEKEGLHASLFEGWYKCMKCDECYHLPTITAFEENRLS